MGFLDVVIVGAGPIGLACAIELEKLGFDYLVFDKGCLVNSLYHYPQNMTFFSTAERLEIGGLPFVSLQSKPGRAEALEYYRRVAMHYELKLRLFEAVTEIKKKEDGDFWISTSRGEYHAKKVIVATGFYDKPVMLNVPGESLPKVSHYYKDPHFYAFQKVLVVGGEQQCRRRSA